MDEETIRREATQAVSDLELDSSVSAITHSGEKWCIQFAGDYGQYCDPFQNQFKRDNSARVIREKIKKHLLGQITQLRNKGGRRTTKRGSDEVSAAGGAANAAELLQDTVTQTTRAIGEAINRTLGFTGAAIKSAGDVAETLSDKATETQRPVRSVESLLPAAAPVEREHAPRKSARKRKQSVKTKQGAKKKSATSRTKRARATKKAARKKSSRKDRL